MLVACLGLFGEAAPAQGSARAGAVADGRSCQLWFLGSSSVRRWTTLAVDMQPWAVRNDGVDGATIRAAAARLTRRAGDPLPRAIVVYGGDNDIAYGIGPSAALADLDGLLAIRAKLGLAGVPLLLLSVKPSPARWALYGPQQAFNTALAARARTTPGLFYVDVARRMLRGGRPGPFYTADGVHMNAAGYAIWRNEVRRTLRRAVPEDVTRGCLRR